MIPDHLRLQPGQEALTTVQEREARRFADEYICKQLSTEPVHEQQAEALLCQAYQVAGLVPPQRVSWLDGPLQLVAVLMQPSREEGAWPSVKDRVGDSMRESVRASIRESVVL